VSENVIVVTSDVVAAARGLLALVEPGETPDPAIVKIANARRRRPGEVLPTDRPRVEAG
jgi:hypothetical protein